MSVVCSETILAPSVTLFCACSPPATEPARESDNPDVMQTKRCDLPGHMRSLSQFDG
jgi:hypothetical protein